MRVDDLDEYVAQGNVSGCWSCRPHRCQPATGRRDRRRLGPQPRRVT